MKSKRMIVVVVSSIVLCLSLFFIFQNETDTSTSNKDLTLIYEEKYLQIRNMFLIKMILCIIQLKFIKMMIIQFMCM